MANLAEIEPFEPPGHSLPWEVFIMMGCMITFRSITPAQRGERTLKNKGISCRLGRTPRKLEEMGCGYSLYVPREKIYEAIAILEEKSVNYRKVYMLSPQGMPEEIVL